MWHDRVVSDVPYESDPRRQIEIPEGGDLSPEGIMAALQQRELELLVDDED